MAKLAAVLAALLCAATWAISSETQEVGACTGVGFPYSDISAPVVFEGRVVAIEPIAPQGTNANHRVSFEVVRGFRGATAGETIKVDTHLLVPGGQPVPCPTLTPEALADRYVVLALPTVDPGGFYPFFTLYIGDAPATLPTAGVNQSYLDAIRLAELGTDSNPTAPLLTIEPAEATCGELVRYRGERFEPGTYLLAPTFGRFIDKITVGEDGTFDVSSTLIFGGCRASSAGTFESPVAVRNPADDGFFSAKGLIEIAPFSVTTPGGGDNSYPQLVIPSGSPRCGAEFTVSGTGFEPHEHVTLIVSTSATHHPATANANGSFDARIPMPSELCGLSLGEVRAFQPGFEAYGRPLAGTYFTPLGPPSGPPDLGNSEAQPGTPIPWLHLAALATLILGASLLTARR